MSKPDPLLKCLKRENNNTFVYKDCFDLNTTVQIIINANMNAINNIYNGEKTQKIEETDKNLFVYGRKAVGKITQNENDFYGIWEKTGTIFKPHSEDDNETTVHYKNGDIYLGKTRGLSFHIEDGNGLLIYKENGQVYLFDGTFKYGKKSGYGKIYKGEWQDDNTKFTIENTPVKTGFWLNNKLEAETKNFGESDIGKVTTQIRSILEKNFQNIQSISKKNSLDINEKELEVIKQYHFYNYLIEQVSIQDSTFFYVEYKNEDKYWGDLNTQNKKTGIGIILYKNKSGYFGNFQLDTPNKSGNGIYFNESGIITEIKTNKSYNDYLKKKLVPSSDVPTKKITITPQTDLNTPSNGLVTSTTKDIRLVLPKQQFSSDLPAKDLVVQSKTFSDDLTSNAFVLPNQNLFLPKNDLFLQNNNLVSPSSNLVSPSSVSPSNDLLKSSADLFLHPNALKSPHSGETTNPGDKKTQNETTNPGETTKPGETTTPNDEKEKQKKQEQENRTKLLKSLGYGLGAVGVAGLSYYMYKKHKNKSKSKSKKSKRSPSTSQSNPSKTTRKRRKQRKHI